MTAQQTNFFSVQGLRLGNRNHFFICSKKLWKVGPCFSYLYDLAGNRVKVTYGGTGRTVVSTYDALNRLLTLTESAAP